jgi:hypothetical protein
MTQPNADSRPTPEDVPDGTLTGVAREMHSVTIHDVACAFGDVVAIRACESDPRYVECLNAMGSVRSVHLRDEYIGVSRDPG